jgi:hypothetical protein
MININFHENPTRLKPVATHAVNDSFRPVKHGFGTVHNGTAILVVANILHRGNAVAERFSAVADGAAASKVANDVKPVLNFGSSDVNVRNVNVRNVNVRNVNVHFIELGYNTIQYFIF